MRTFRKVILILLVAAFISLSLLGCAKVTDTITLPQISISTELDGSIAALSGDNSEKLLSNPDRGFRLETYYTLGSERAWPTDEDSSGYDMLDEEMRYYASDNAKVIQVYVYLSEYSTKPLDDSALDKMKTYFEYIRSLDMTILLRFAYDYDQGEGVWVSPSQTILLGHLAQLKKFMADNTVLINDTVSTYQFGCIGAWGEWGASGAKYDEEKVLNALVDMMPSNTYYQGRYMRVTNQLRQNNKYEYVGYHNDFLVARPHPWNTAGNKYGSNDYKEFAATSQYRLNDGEMPWGGFTDEPNEIVDGKKFIIQMMEHRMTTLSIKHNYIETNKGEGKFNIARWKEEYITEKELKEMNCPIYPQYFKDGGGRAIERTIYEYLRDFLGYQLMASNYSRTIVGNNTVIRFMLTNFGMSAPLNTDQMQLVVTDDNGTQYINIGSYNAKQLISYGQQKYSVKLSASLSTNARIGIRILRKNPSANNTIRLANNIDYIDGINYIN